MGKALKLNVDIAGSISELESAVREFSLRKKIFRTLFRGKGLDFDGYRTYAPDDDASNIDWKASKRANSLLVKQYSEEKDIKILFVVDVGEHMVFGSTKKLKCEYVAELTAALAHLILDSGNKVGFILYSDKTVDFIIPRKGESHFRSIVDVICSSSSYGGKSNIGKVLEFVDQYVDESISSVILVSDFIQFDKKAEKFITFLGSRHETVAFMVKDPMDTMLPKVSAEVVVEDPASGEQVLVDPAVASVQYRKHALEQEKQITSIFLDNNVELLKFDTSKSFVIPLSELIRHRLGGGG